MILITGALYDIGFGQKLYLGCMGEGFPTGRCDILTFQASPKFYPLLAVPLSAQKPTLEVRI